MVLTILPQEVDDTRTPMELENSLLYDFIDFEKYDGEFREFKETEYPKAWCNGSHDDTGQVRIFIYGHGEDLFLPGGFKIDEIMFDQRLKEIKEVDETWLPSFENDVFDIHEGYETDKEGNPVYIHNACMTHYVYQYIWFQWDDELPFEYFKDYQFIIINNKKFYVKWQSNCRSLK